MELKMPWSNVIMDESGFPIGEIKMLCSCLPELDCIACTKRKEDEAQEVYDAFMKHELLCG